jgi:hypothetical protein
MMRVDSVTHLWFMNWSIEQRVLIMGIKGQEHYVTVEISEGPTFWKAIHTMIHKPRTFAHRQEH